LIPGPIRCADDVSEVRWFPRASIPFRSVAFLSMRRALRKGIAVYPQVTPGSRT
jgi:hypothetical protein